MVKEVVEGILKADKRARNSDKYLMVMVYRKLGITDIAQLLKSDTPCPESIRRMRQKFQQDGLYLAEKEVKEERAANEERIYYEMIFGCFQGVENA